MSCPDQQTLSAFVDHELEAAQALETEQHVASCASCRQFVQEMQWLDRCGRAALGAIDAGNVGTPKVVRLKPLWARPVAWSAAAAIALCALSFWMWFAHSHRHQAPVAPQIASGGATRPNSDIEAEESSDTAFAQWAAPYRELQIPLVPMEVAASYEPSPIPQLRQ